MTSPAAWAHPEALPLGLGLLLALGIAWILAWRRASRRLERLVGRRLPLRSLKRDAAPWAALAALTLAWAGPRIGERTLWIPAQGVDVAVLLDVSRSMDARDVAPARLDRARRMAGSVLRSLEPGDRAALAAFAGRGVLLTPLTPDTSALEEMLPGLDAELIRPQGSSLANGVSAALRAFPADSDRARVLLVLSDGEDPRPEGRTGEREASRARVRVVTVGFGSEAGAEIPDHGLALRDAGGETVVTRRDLTRLELLAAATGGRAFAADAWGEVSLPALRAELRRDAGQPGGPAQPQRVPARRILPFVLLALGLVWLELARPPGSRPRSSSGRQRAWAAGLGTLAVLLGAGEHARGQSRGVAFDARAEIEHGLSSARRGRPDEAVHAFTGAAVRANQPGLAAVAYYDLGVVELRRGRLESARDAFLDAVALDPEDLAARFNLEWTLQALAVRSPPPPETGPEESMPSETATTPEPGEARPLAHAASGQPARPRPPAGDVEESATPHGAEKLSASEIEHWLEAVRDAPAAALRHTAGGEPRAPRRSEEPAW